MLRLVVMGLGLGVITGTVLKLLAPQLASGAASRSSAGNPTPPQIPQLKAGLALGSFVPRRELTGRLHQHHRHQRQPWEL